METKISIRGHRPPAGVAPSKTAVWRDAVGRAAYEYCGKINCLSGCGIDLEFFVLRPKNHIDRDGIRPEAPVLPLSKPDITKAVTVTIWALMRAIGCPERWCAAMTARKSWVCSADLQGVDITIRTENL